MTPSAPCWRTLKDSRLRPSCLSSTLFIVFLLGAEVGSLREERHLQGDSFQLHCRSQRNSVVDNKEFIFPEIARHSTAATTHTTVMLVTWKVRVCVRTQRSLRFRSPCVCYSCVVCRSVRSPSWMNAPKTSVEEESPVTVQGHRFLRLLRTGVRLAIRPQVLYRQRHPQKRFYGKWFLCVNSLSCQPDSC